MKPLLIIAIFLSFTFTVLGQQNTMPDDSGFTNKTEAKNLMVNGLKEGKWIEYVDDNKAVTTDASKAQSYRLMIYKAGYLYGIIREYNKDGKLIWKAETNPEIIFNYRGMNKSDSGGFINWKEARNLRVNGLKEGKWLDSVYTSCCDRPIGDSNLLYFRLATYKQGRIIGKEHYYGLNWGLANGFFKPISISACGTIRDKDTYKPIKGIVVKKVGSDGSVDYALTDVKGNYSFDPTTIHTNTSYILSVDGAKQGYNNSSEKYNMYTVGCNKSKIYTYDWELQKQTSTEIKK